MANSTGIAVAGMPKGRPARSWVGRTLGPMAHGSLRGSIFMFMSSAIGPGALLLPYMFRLIGIPGGLLLIAFGAFCTAQSLRFVITIAHLTGCDSFAGGVSAVLGQTAGNMVGHLTSCVLILAIGSHLKFLTSLLPCVLPAALFNLASAQLIALLLVFPFCASKDISSLRHIAMVAPLSLIYVIVLIIWRGIVSVPEDAHQVLQHGEILDLLRFGDGGSWGLPQAWSILLNTVTCHQVAVPVYKQLHKAQPQRINKVVLRVTAYLSVLYGLVGVSGLLALGKATPENVLLAYPAGDTAALVAQTLVGMTLLVAVPLNTHAVRDQMNRSLPARAATALKSSSLVRCAVTAAILLVTAVISNGFPNVTSIIGIACGFGMVLYMFVVPCVVMCALRWRRGPGIMRGHSGESLTELLLSSPLSSPLMGPKKSGMVSPKWSESDLKRLDRAPSDEGLADDLDLLLPEALENDDGTLLVVQDTQTSGVRGRSGSSQTQTTASPRLTPGMRPVRRDYAAQAPALFPLPRMISSPRGMISSPRTSSPPWSNAASEFGGADIETEWSVEFALAIAAMVLASGLGFTAAGRTLVGLIAG